MAGEMTKKKVRSSSPICTLSCGTGQEAKLESLHDGEIGATKGEIFIRAALSDYVVLQNIISNLDNDDVESCCQVNKFWEFSAAPFLVSYYDIKLLETYETSDDEDDDDERRSSFYFFITKRAAYNSDQVYYFRYTFEDASKLLEAALEKGKLAIHLNSQWNNTIRNFVSKFGTWVEKLALAENFTTTMEFAQILVNSFPNLKHLDLSSTSFGFANDGKYFEDNPMKHLRRMDIETEGYHHTSHDYLCLANIFKMAPNLEEIHDLPIRFMDAVVVSQKANCVKTLKYPSYPDSKFPAAIEKLAKFEPKLDSFSFEYLQAWPKESLCSVLAQTQPFVQKILLSNQNNLQSLTLCRSESFEFTSVPSLTSLKEVTFWMWEREDEVTKFFAPDVVLRQIFPNVSAVCILSNLYHYDILDIRKRLPENQFSPWGAQIDKITIEDVSVEILEQLSKLFPEVRKMQFRIPPKTNDLRLLLPAVAEYWPKIECLHVNVAYTLYSCSKTRDDEQCSFDSVFTGIPHDTVVLLRDPLSREKDVSPQEIQNFKDASTIRKMCNLKIVRFDLDRLLDSTFVDNLSGMTSISKEFGFQFLPGLQVILRVRREDQFQQVVDMRATLQKLVNFDVEIEVLP